MKREKVWINLKNPKTRLQKKNCFKNFSLWFDLYVRNGKECEEDGDDYGNEEWKTNFISEKKKFKFAVSEKLFSTFEK